MAKDPYSEEALREQWDFLDTMVERQATTLRAGGGDEEEPEMVPVSAATPGADREAIHGLEQRLEAAHTEIDRLKRALADANVHNQRLEAAHTEIARLKHALAESDTHREQLEAAEHEIKRLRHVLVDGETKLERLTNSHDDLLNALREAHEAAQVQPTAPVAPQRRRWPWSK